MTNTKPLPSEIELERHFIAKLLLDPKKAKKTNLSPDLFSYPACQAVFSAILQMPADQMDENIHFTLGQSLREVEPFRNGAMKPASFITDLLNLEATADGIVLLADRVREASQARQLSLLLSEALNDLKIDYAPMVVRNLSKSLACFSTCTDIKGSNKPPAAIITNLSDVEPEEVSWLWNPYIPLGKLTILEGDPGIGKTWLALQLAANVSQGNPFPGSDGIPGGRREPANVVYLTAKDGLADTLRPRLDKAKADVTRIYTSEGYRSVNDAGKEVVCAITLEALAIIEEIIKRVMPALMVVDPLQAYLGAHVDINRANEVRPLLAGLGRLAEKYQVAVICIRHLGKGPQERAIYRGLGSIDFAAAARSVLLVGQDPQNKHRRIIAQSKSSLAAVGVSLAFELTAGEFLWCGTSELNAESLLSNHASDEEGSAIDDAIEFLKEDLADGPKAAKEIFKEARKQGLAIRTLKRAKAKLNVRSKRKNRPGEKRGEGEWTWFLQETQDEENNQNVIRENDDLLGTLEESQAQQGLIKNLQEGHMTPLKNLEKPPQPRGFVQEVQESQANILREKIQDDHDGSLENNESSDSIINLETFEKINVEGTRR